MGVKELKLATFLSLFGAGFNPTTFQCRGRQLTTVQMQFGACQAKCGKTKCC